MSDSATGSPLLPAPRELRRIAVIGTGISGLVAAWLLHRGGHQVTVFEAGSSIGGHTNTVPVTIDGRTFPVDTGFIVFNDRTYPNFIRLLAHLGVASRASTMSFSVRCEVTGLEWNGANLDTLFAQRRNLLRPGFLRMVRDILRFSREALRLLDDDQDSPGPTLGEYLDVQRYSREFAHWYLLPMGGAIWSTPERVMRDMPARFFVRFFHHHGMLSVADRPQWRTVAGGSSTYIAPLVAGLRSGIRLDAPVLSLVRDPLGVTVTSRFGEERFDGAVVAAHADDALRLLGDPSQAECSVLGAFRYQDNSAILHTDAALLPRRRKVWAAWNYHRLADPDLSVPVTYNMNILQGFAGERQFLLSLNRDSGIDPALIIRRIAYRHPVYSLAAIQAQRRRRDINGRSRTWFCGAYWGNGFHEDGVVSALAVARDFGQGMPAQHSGAVLAPHLAASC
jgi:predicted NAD/FAD-binding protein